MFGRFVRCSYLFGLYQIDSASSEQKWRLKTMEARADRYRSQSLVIPCFFKWQGQAQAIHHLNSLATNFTQQNEADLVYDALGKWHHRTAVSLAEREVTARREDALLRDAWQTWTHRKSVCPSFASAQKLMYSCRRKTAAADRLYATNLQRAVLSLWRSSLLNQKVGTSACTFNRPLTATIAHAK